MPSPEGCRSSRSGTTVRAFGRASGKRLDPPRGHPRLHVRRIETNKLADLAERNATLINQPPHEPGRDAEPLGDLAHIEQRGGRKVAVCQANVHTVVKAAMRQQRDKTVTFSTQRVRALMFEFLPLSDVATL